MLSNIEALNIGNIRKITGCGRIYYFESLNSTNTWLLENGKCGDICISEAQSAGRGRRGNNWVSPEGGNIYFSLYWCLNGTAEHLSLLGLVTGIAIAESLSDIGLTGHGVKWPNDIIYQNKKMGGILLETKDQSGKVVIGIGLNVTLSAETKKSIDQGVITISEVLENKKLSRDVLIINLIKRLSERLNMFETLNYANFIKSWKEWDILQGKTVYFEHQGSSITGEVAGIDRHGRLEILNKSGEFSYYSSADIKLAKNKGSL